MEGKPRNLIETVATDIATNILQDYREVKGLKISVQKPHVALDGVVKSMGAPPFCFRRQSLLCQSISIALRCLPSSMFGVLWMPRGMAFWAASHDMPLAQDCVSSTLCMLLCSDYHFCAFKAVALCRCGD